MLILHNLRIWGSNNPLDVIGCTNMGVVTFTFDLLNNVWVEIEYRRRIAGPLMLSSLNISEM
jgi:hypothetical protein